MLQFSLTSTCKVQRRTGRELQRSLTTRRNSKRRARPPGRECRVEEILTQRYSGRLKMPSHCAFDGRQEIVRIGDQRTHSGQGRPVAPNDRQWCRTTGTEPRILLTAAI